MMRRRVRAAGAILVCVAGACSAGDTAPSPVVLETAPTTTSAALTTADVGASPTTTPSFGDGPLADVCDDTIVVQASSFPDIGIGPLYSLLGASPTVDVARQAVAAPLVRADGSIEQVTLEIRSGGPSIGFRSPVAVMAEDETIHLADASTAVAVRDHAVLATRAVATLTDRSRDALIVDPGTYDDIVDLTDLRSQDIEIRHVTDAPVITYLVASGVLDPNQLTAGSDGLPASFVEADGVLVQQGDLTVEPVLLPSLPQWGRPVAALPASGAGWESLDDMLVVDAETNRLTDACLGRFVRVVQQAIVAYANDPTATNLVMSDVRAQFNPLARLTPELLDAGTQLAIEAGVFDTARSDAPGTIDTSDLDAFLTDLAGALEVDLVTADELIDTTFIDTTISR